MNADPDSFSSFKVAPGYDRLQMPHGLQVLVVENPLYLPHAIKRLRASMEDPVIAIDLEWRPQFGTKFTPVAMVQLATSRVALLVRTCRMQYRLAAELVALLTDPTVTILGFSWASADEAKMQRTFGLGAGAIPGFLDLQLVAHGLGWNGYGLARLTNAVLGSPLPKSKRVSMSNWESRTLTRQQVKYAALDVLIAGQVFRGLRLWHRSPSPCATCFQPLGVVQPPLKLVCSTPGCGREFGDDLLSYASHCRQLRHQPDVQECAACGCLRHVAVAEAGVQPLAAEPPLAQAVRASDAAAPPAAPQQQRADGGETGAGCSIGDDSSSGGSSDSGGAVEQASASESAGRDEQELKQHQEHKQRQKEGGWGNVVVATLHGVRATAEESATVAVRALASIGPSTWSAAGHVQGQSKQQHTVRPEQVAVGGVNSQEQQKKGRPRKRKRPASDE
ncbi:hypothetical protein MNEG_4210 [Monoraphidium neglectum]|uniref:3'-5' exonuclease domain-containing protein n=1 Tax=Monoraphidium neglectum TaxID=145388 RepID=A0A0D2JZ11_9CHLO|nr:hypothetical protein MNEG_4210 [Monoraphidium neglectum]KIZ03748.1 hypothetical protein MNEG_4210 [Monoraphidium neglectum]|eukprot:XP_013902767.1 hypothetical protein MNEG_4210 [Monoraphidium neglectum]